MRFYRVAKKKKKKKTVKVKRSQLSHFGIKLYISNKERERALELHKTVPLKDNKNINNDNNN